MSKVLPSRDDSFNTFQVNFLVLVQGDMVNWGIPADDVTPLTNAQTNWTSAWAVAKNKNTRTPQQTKIKTEAREAYEAVLLPFIQHWIMTNPLVTDDEIMALGLQPRETEHTPIPVPITIPAVRYELLSGNKVKVYFRQEIAEPGTTGRGKPKGVAYCEFVYKIGGAAPVSAAECNVRQLSSRSPLICEFEQENAGQKVYCYARWVNPRGEGGGWTSLDSFMVP